MARGFKNFAGRDKKDSLRETDIFEMYKLSDEAADQWVHIRLMPGDILPVKKHWIELAPKEAGKKGISIPRMCVQFDPDNTFEALKGRKCPYCKIPHQNKDDQFAPARADLKFLACAIIRDIQEDGPGRKATEPTKSEKKTGFKEMGSKSWTPIRVIPLTGGNVNRINEISERNTHKAKGEKGKKAYDVNDAKFGCDLEIRFRTAKGIPPGDRYQIEKGDCTPLTKEEKEYLTFNLEPWEEIYDQLGRLDNEGALADFKRMDIKGLGIHEEDEDDDEDDDMSLGKKKKKGSKDKKAKKSSRFSDDDDDDDEDEAPKKKKKKTRSLLDDDDEDDRPKKKKKKKSSDDDEDEPKKKKKKKRSDDDDEDEAPKKKKKKKSSDDDDEPKKKKKKKK